jgi:eukaryotic-like serine/threonine-protein kinase
VSDARGAPSAATQRLGGRYLLREEVGRGGMAVVYRAVDTVLDREVAAKLLHRTWPPTRPSWNASGGKRAQRRA